MGAVVYSGCPTNKPLQFACGDSTGVKYTSPSFPSMNLLSGDDCTDFAGGANNYMYGSYILAIDSSDPGCEQYNAGYDIYMHFGKQWGCNGTYGTHLKTGWWFSVSYIEGKQYFSKIVILKWIVNYRYIIFFVRIIIIIIRSLRS